MTELAIHAERVSKRYLLGAATDGAATFKEVISAAVAAPLRRLKAARSASRDTLWALKGVGFAVEVGEVVGLIGRNGSGKSTLLKILSHITEPTEGRVELHARVASLMEVGTGFHPELTGRENIFLNGAILGMTRREIQRKFDEIVAFAEVERFLDTPVKWYSSGMYLRLAFAVAAHLEPEILLVDEVLAVGDAAFQRKCLGKMGQVAKEGRTIFFVSHNMAAIRGLCSRALLLDNGHLVADADTESVVAKYLMEGHVSGAAIEWEEEIAPRAPELRFVRACILNDQGEPASLLDCRKGFIIVIEYDVLREVSGLRVGFFVQTIDGIAISGSNDPEAWPEITRKPGRYRSQCRFPGYTLNAGTYSVCFSADLAPFRVVLSTPYCLTFMVEDVEGHGPLSETLPGVLRPRLEWRVAQLAGR